MKILSSLPQFNYNKGPENKLNKVNEVKIQYSNSNKQDIKSQIYFNGHGDSLTLSKGNLPVSKIQPYPLVITKFSFKGNTLLDGIYDEISQLQAERAHYQPKLPAVLKNGIGNVVASAGEVTTAAANADAIEEMFPMTYGAPVISFIKGKNSTSLQGNIGVVLSGGQAPGGHNVVAGIFDALKEVNPDGKLYGFLNGPKGIIKGKSQEITDQIIDKYRNTGGFDIIGSGRDKIEKPDEFQAALDNCKKQNISTLIVIGGDDSNTNAALLAEYFCKKNADIKVIGVPKTIDGDLKNSQVETSFGFDTATKTYSELIGNIERDALSAKKYWHFVKLMGRSASHVTLESALQTHPNITLISEEVAQKKMSLDEVVDNITSTVVDRSKNGKNYGVALVPEGLIEFIPEMKSLISDLNNTLANIEKSGEKRDGFSKMEPEKKIDFIKENLQENNARVFSSLPKSIQTQLLMDRDSHGNVQVSKIDTEKLLMEMVHARISRINKEIRSQNAALGENAKKEEEIKFSPQGHFLGYEGRCAAPSNFDADYCYTLGYSAVALANSGLTGYISSVKNLTDPAEKWAPGGAPLTMMMNMETRKGEMKPVIKKALVELDGPVFRELEKNRNKWAKEDCYVFPGPIQYFGPARVTDMPAKTILLEKAG